MHANLKTNKQQGHYRDRYDKKKRFKTATYTPFAVSGCPHWEQHFGNANPLELEIGLDGPIFLGTSSGQIES